MTKPLFKTTIVIWSETENRGFIDLQDIAWAADQGPDYCSVISEVLVPNPEEDPDWDGTEFFEDNDWDAE